MFAQAKSNEYTCSFNIISKNYISVKSFASKILIANRLMMAQKLNMKNILILLLEHLQPCTIFHRIICIKVSIFNTLQKNSIVKY